MSQLELAKMGESGLGGGDDASQGLVTIVDRNRLLLDLLGDFIVGKRLFDIERRYSWDQKLTIPKSASDRHLLLVDPETPGVDGLRGVERMVYDYPKSKVVIFSNRMRSTDIMVARQSGVWGYISKDMSPMSVCSALLLIASSEKYFQFDLQEVAERDEHAVCAGLSKIEAEALRLVACGKTNAEISGALGVSESTVKMHVRSLMNKTRCRNRTQLAIRYLTQTD